MVMLDMGWHGQKSRATSWLWAGAGTPLLGQVHTRCNPLESALELYGKHA